jgi:hypothetical protein
MKVFNNQPMPVLTLGDRVQSLEINKIITTDRVSECMLICETNSNYITQIQTILSALIDVPLEHELGNILLWNTTLDTPPNAIVLTSSPQELVTENYLDLYNKLNTDDIQFGDTFQVPYMTDESTPGPFTASANSESDTAWHALNSGTTTAAEDIWQGTTKNGSWFRLDFGDNYYHIVELAVRVVSSNRTPTNFRLEGINNDDSFTTIKTYSNQTGYSYIDDRILTLPVNNNIYKGFRLFVTTMVGSALGFMRFSPTLQAPVNPDSFYIPAQPSTPQTGKQWIMIVSNS